ncbi:MAG: FAD-binding protein [Chloroflexota bacterium]|nr:FAD-binding protein [Chloroflexota bacterium]
MTTRAPDTVADLQAFVRDSERVHVVGNGSKTALHCAVNGAAIADLSGMSGIIEYQPSEYTVTARAGTPVRELNAALRQKSQYLPFDPLLPEQATIGGTVASNLSGSRRFRYGGVRDFILGAEVVDGEGRTFRVGGKVVKNSAGFDLSKFLVGSLGKYAIMTELTFKVFPDVPRFRSLGFLFEALEDALSAIYFINQSAYELDALDLAPARSVPQINRGKQDGNWKLLARLAGFDDTLPQRVERFTAAMTGDTATIRVEELKDSAALWNPLADLSGEFLVKVVIPPKQLPAFDALIAHDHRRYSVGGNIAWAATDDIAQLDTALKACGLTGLCLRGAVNAAVIGVPIDNPLAERVKQVLDPHGKLV